MQIAALEDQIANQSLSDFQYLDGGSQGNRFSAVQGEAGYINVMSIRGWEHDIYEIGAEAAFSLLSTMANLSLS